VIVVLGADADRLGAELAGLDVHLVHNPDYAEGLSSSLRRGVEAAGSARAVLVTLADQPLVTADDLRGLVAEYERGGAAIVAASYGDTVGVPAIFDSSLFSELAGLRGDAGARAVIEAHRSECRLVPIPAAATDVDSPEDWERLL
jgi:molybdenum cofactor cytidylyltransferase